MNKLHKIKENIIIANLFAFLIIPPFFQPCPEGSADFRAQQCAAYNDVPHGDSLYEWVPYFEPRDPCSLRCKAKGQNFGIMLAPKVLDGTRCQENSLDMCINGKCRVSFQWLHLFFSYSFKRIDHIDSISLKYDGPKSHVPIIFSF